MNIRLTDEELRGAVSDSLIRSTFVKIQLQEVAKAQLKKLVDIIKRDCPETLFLLEDLAFWHELLKEIE